MGALAPFFHCHDSVAHMSVWTRSNSSGLKERKIASVAYRSPIPLSRFLGCREYWRSNQEGKSKLSGKRATGSGSGPGPGLGKALAKASGLFPSTVSACVPSVTELCSVNVFVG